MAQGETLWDPLGSEDGPAQGWPTKPASHQGSSPCSLRGLGPRIGAPLPLLLLADTLELQCLYWAALGRLSLPSAPPHLEEVVPRASRGGYAPVGPQRTGAEGPHTPVDIPAPGSASIGVSGEGDGGEDRSRAWALQG